MKRLLLIITLVGLGISSIYSQSKPITPVINASGKFKKAYEDIPEGTQCTFRNVVRLKRIPKDSYMEPVQAVVIINNMQKAIPLNSLGVIEFDYDKNSFWYVAQIQSGLLKYYENKGIKASLRSDQEKEGMEYIKQLRNSRMIYEDDALQDYLQCMLLSIYPSESLLPINVNPEVYVISGTDPDMFMLGNGALFVTTGMLSILDNEDELYGMMARTVAHYMFDDALITIQKNISRAKRAAFWGAVADGVTAATEAYLYEKNDYYEPGIVFATNDLVQTLINDNINRRMGIDFSEAQEIQADYYASLFLNKVNRDVNALPSALNKVYAYYNAQIDKSVIQKYGSYGYLTKQIEKLGEFKPTTTDRVYCKRICGVISYVSGMNYYNKNYSKAKKIALLNIDNQTASPEDYIMAARCTMKISNTPESINECRAYLDKADEISPVINLNICKMKILLLLRENKQIDAVDLLQQYQSHLVNMYQQPHNKSDDEWIASEQTWVQKQLDRINIM